MDNEAVDLTTGEAARTATCPNCYTEIAGPFCASCGQQQKNLNKYIWSLAGDLMDDIFRPDSRAARTLVAVMFRPGYLTTEYFAGRRMRYVPPVRLYLIVSFLFFFVIPLLTQVQDEIPEQITITSDQEETQDWREKLNEAEAQIALPWFNEEENKALSERFSRQLEKTLDQSQSDPYDTIADFMDVLSAVMFFMLPIFAVFLKIFYIGSGVYYAEHLLLAVHNHCFLFLVFLISTLLDLGNGTALAPVTLAIDTGLNFWVPIYMFISLKHVFGQGYFMTLFKFTLLGTTYLFLALFGFLAAAVTGVMMA